MPDQQVDFSNFATTTFNSNNMPVDRGSHVTRRYAPYGSSAGVRHRGPRALARYGTRVGSAKKGWKRSRNAIVSVPRSKLAFPTGMRTKLRFCQQVAFEPTHQSNIVHYAYRANALTDPTATGTGGHQPRGFDQFMAVYRTYTVMASKISVNFVYKAYDGPASLDGGDAYLIKTVETVNTAAEAAALAPVMVGIHKGVTELTVGSAAQTMEQDRTVWRPMTPQDGAVTLGSSMRTSDFFGKGSLVGAEGYTGSITADPDNLIYFDVWLGRADLNTQGVVKCMGFITIEYDVQFTEPKTLTES